MLDEARCVKLRAGFLTIKFTRTLLISHSNVSQKSHSNVIGETAFSSDILSRSLIAEIWARHVVMRCDVKPSPYFPDRAMILIPISLSLGAFILTLSMKPTLYHKNNQQSSHL